MRIGGYELGKELHRGPDTVVALARRADVPGKTAYAVRRFIPVSLFENPESARAEAESFLEGCRLQQKLADGPGRHWAPVQECGLIEPDRPEAYVVTDFYPRSLAQYIAGRAKLSGDTLYVILRAVLEGLKELEAFAHRGHGALTPGKVLFSSKKKVSGARIFLTDPAPQPPETPPDSYALGCVIYEFVFHRPYSPAFGWPLRPAQEWHRLGAKGEKWREFCSRLLNPGARPTLDEVLTVARGLKPGAGKKVAGGLALVAVAAVLLLAVGLTLPGAERWPGVSVLKRTAAAVKEKVFAWRAGGVQRSGDRDWRDLCARYLEWFGALSAGLNENRRALWAQDAALAEVLADWDHSRAEGIEFDPRRIAQAPSTYLAYLKDHPPRNIESPEMADRIRAARLAMNRIDDKMGPDSWPARARLAEWADAHRQRGWSRTAAYLALLETRLPARGRRADIAAVDEVVKLTPLLEFIENRWRSSEGLPEREVWIPILAELNAKAEAAGAQDGFSAVLAVHATLAGTIEESPPAVEEPPPTVIETAVIVEPEPRITEEQLLRDKVAAGLTAQDEISLTGSATVNEIWREQRQKLIEAESAPDDLQAAADRMRQFLEEVDWMLALEAPSGNPTPASVWLRREETLRRILDAAFGPDAQPLASAEDFLAAADVSKAVQSFDRWRLALDTPTP